MSEPTCATCKHFRGTSDAECFRFPATIRVYENHRCGEHAPRQPVGAGVGLPEPWRFRATSDGSTYASSPTTAGWCGVSENGLVSSASAPPEVVAIVIAAHRARGEK